MRQEEPNTRQLRHVRALLASVPLSLVLVACSRESTPATVHAASASVARAPEPAARPSANGAPDSAASSGRLAQNSLPARARSTDARVAALRRALDFGRLDEVRARQADAALAPDETAELRARAAALEGRTLEALRLLEAWRTSRPSDPVSYAAAAEIYGSAQKFDAAWEELGRGEKSCGASAELARAKGVLWILREGGAEKGLAQLSAALAADPALAFADRALAQAHLLVAKLDLRAAQKPNGTDAAKFASACAHVGASLQHDPDDVDALRLDADLAASRGDFDHALGVLGGLLARGEPLRAELALTYKKAAFGALLGHRRDVALERFRIARELGLGADELGSGALLLEHEARALSGDGLDAFARGDTNEAEQCFTAALRWDPDEIASRNQLGVIAFKRGAYADAVEAWRQVLDTARRESLELPEPVHLNLAKALVLAGDRAAALDVLCAELGARPEGRWAEATRALFDALSRGPAR